MENAWQALKSGQLPADFQIPDDNDTKNGKGKDEKEVSDSEAEVEPRNTEEQGNDEPAPMEQVFPASFCI